MGSLDDIVPYLVIYDLPKGSHNNDIKYRGDLTCKSVSQSQQATDITTNYNGGFDGGYGGKDWKYYGVYPFEKRFNMYQNKIFLPAIYFSYFIVVIQ